MFLSLDNEPELWNYIHLEVQGSSPASDSSIARAIAVAKVLQSEFRNFDGANSNFVTSHLSRIRVRWSGSVFMPVSAMSRCPGCGLR